MSKSKAKSEEEEEKAYKARLLETDDFRRRLQRYRRLKEEWEAKQTEVCLFNSKDEMTVRKVCLGDVPVGAVRVRDIGRGEEAVHQVDSDLFTDRERFTDNLHKVNQQRVANKRPQLTEVAEVAEEETQTQVLLDLSRLEQPKDAVFMDMLALYSRALHR